MKKTAIAFTGAILAVTVNTALADRIGGGPKADFHTDELIIPCVEVTGLSEATEGMFFDVVLSRRGSSMNYELSAAEAEDPELCEAIANFAEFEDDDFEDPDDDNADALDILVECEVRPDRSKISVEGKNLEAGSYFAEVSSNSGGDPVDSGVKAPIDNEVEFDFDSNLDEIAEGAVAIPADFISGEQPEVTGKIFRSAGAGVVELVLSETVTCSQEQEQEQEQEED